MIFQIKCGISYMCFYTARFSTKPLNCLKSGLGALFNGRQDNFDVSTMLKRKLKRRSKGLECCREDLLVQEDYYYCLHEQPNSFAIILQSVTGLKTMQFCRTMNRDLFQHVETVVKITLPLITSRDHLNSPYNTFKVSVITVR